MRLSSFASIATALEAGGVRYLVAGGLAVNAHGYLFVSEPFGFDEEYGHALVKPLHGSIMVRFVSVPTLIRMKQEAGRPQDLTDIEHLSMLQGKGDDG